MATVRTFNPPPGPVMYMLIDITTPEGTKILKVADLKCITMWGHIFKQQGRKVIAPPVEGRGFSKLEKLNLQYLYWDLTQEIPPDEYRDLIQNALLAVQKIEPDGKTFEELMREIKRLGINLGDPTTPVPKVEKDPNAFPIRPKGTSTTGQVWELADTEFEKAGNQMPNRAAVIAACEAAGINGSTAATQYAKWKKAKGI
jgi:hypothetical protein